MKITNKVDIAIINDYVNREYLLCQKHPTAPFLILNYSRKVQYENLWDEITLSCRGLIIHQDSGEVIARPFSKFLNFEQLKPENIPNLPFDVYEKMDGSLGILYWFDSRPYIASRGSFQSDQAIHANEVFYSKYQNTFDLLNKDATYLFEIIYKTNRIVCDYGDMDDLVLLAVIDNKTGKDLPLVDIGFPVVKRYDGIKDFSSLRNDNDMQREGYIVRFSNGFRMKLKYQEYCRIHSIVTGISTLTIWEHLMQNKSLDELIDHTPDEFDQFVQNTAENLNGAYTTIEYAHKRFMSENEIVSSKFNTRKEQAEVILNQKEYNPKILFNMIDGKDYSSVIWNMIRPKWSRPFSINDEN